MKVERYSLIDYIYIGNTEQTGCIHPSLKKNIKPPIFLVIENTAIPSEKALRYPQ